ncbi:hypothetical protein EDD28_3161 [Salana multivorans]|uniref:Uncharacterized protein n=1 Tax=Salana multivorans TaxID=120377 RepID=A0A3N2D1U4_9MICO|nr:hypothetical protein [Salana multivorans]ROR93739.1 hypothetical protein EDD28_3161 [Salana multivorans]
MSLVLSTAVLVGSVAVTSAADIGRPVSAAAPSTQLDAGASPAQGGEGLSPADIARLNSLDHSSVGPLVSGGPPSLRPGPSPLAASIFWCPSKGGDPYETMATYTRTNIRNIPNGKNTLRCGRPTKDGWGFLHIRDSHAAEWEALDSFLGWDVSMDKNIRSTLQSKNAVAHYKSGNDTYSIQAPGYIYSNRKIVATYTVFVIVAGSDGRIITAYPRGLRWV